MKAPIMVAMHPTQALLGLQDLCQALVEGGFTPGAKVCVCTSYDGTPRPAIVVTFAAADCMADQTVIACEALPPGGVAPRWFVLYALD